MLPEIGVRRASKVYADCDVVHNWEDGICVIQSRRSEPDIGKWGGELDEGLICCGVVLDKRGVAGVIRIHHEEIPRLRKVGVRGGLTRWGLK